MLDALERFLQRGDCGREIDGQADEALVPVIRVPCKGVSWLDDLCAVKDFLVDFVSKIFLNTESELYDFRKGLGVMLRPVADIIFPRISQIESQMLESSRVTVGFFPK